VDIGVAENGTHHQSMVFSGSRSEGKTIKYQRAEVVAVQIQRPSRAGH
jgi:hypothetical protein